MKIRSFCFFVFIVLALFSVSITGKAQVASFTASSTKGCGSLSVIFTNTSTGANNFIWNFGNGSAPVTNPTPPIGATYVTPGTYTVTLTASNGTSSTVATTTINVYVNPVAGFTTNVITTTCIGQPVVFTNTSTAGGGQLTNLHWDFGDGTNLNTYSATCSHSYSSAGTFPVSLMASDTNGCFHSVVHTVNVLAAPVAAFSGNTLTKCAPPLIVTFTNSSTSSGTVTYAWDFGDPSSGALNSSSLPSPGHTYNTTGNFTVTLIITQGGCIDTVVKSNYIIINNIVAGFSVNNDTVCLGQSVSFTDLSAPLSTTRTWDFGDGTNSAAANPSHTYTLPGTYPVTLNATASGCSDTLTKTSYVTVFPLPVVGFATNATQSCSSPFTVNFTDTTTNAVSWSWNFGDPTSGAANTASISNPTHVYLNPGNYTITLQVTNANGCSKTLVKNGFIKISPPLAAFTATPREGCVPLTVTFLSSSTSTLDPIASYYWSFGDGNSSTTLTPTVSNTYTSTGIFTDTLIITTSTGCVDTIIRTNYIKTGSQPTANYSIVDSTVCFGTMAEFNDLSAAPADSVFWLFGDGANFSSLLPSIPVTHVYGDTGTYSVSQIVYYNGCPDTLEYDSIVKILLAKPDFTYDLNCTNPYSVDFTDASIGADSITWAFGDATVDTTNNPAPTHIYLTNGLKTIVLTAYNSSTQCSYTKSINIFIADPIAQFTSTPSIGCYPLTVTITNNSQDDNSVIWDFGDGSANSILINPPVHSYPLPDSDTIKLIITDINGCVDSVSQVITIQGPIPLFSSSVLTGCTPLPVTFSDLSVSDSTLVQWTWDFGDGTPVQTTIVDSIIHTYLTPGSYTIIMSVTDKNGCTKTLTKTSFIQPTRPFPAFTVPALACKGNTINFNASASVVAAPAIYSWDFGDGTPLQSGTPVTHSFSSDGSYSVSLTITDKNGCDSTVQHQILVQQPVAAIEDSVFSQGCGFTNIQFTDISTGSSITGWQWDFGDGGSATQQNPFHSYTSPGTYSISLIVTNSAGCTDSAKIDSLVIVLGPVGTFSFTPSIGCNPLSVNFTASSSNTSGYLWDFGDGTVGNTVGNTINHVYTQDLVATPILLLSNILPNGSPCQLPAPSAGTVTVSTLLSVDIAPTVISLNQDEEITINSTVYNTLGTPVYSWSPAAGLSCSNCQSPVVFGNGSGESITYTLSVTDPTAGGCVAKDSVTLIFPVCVPEPQMPNAFSPNDDGINDLFEIKGTCEKDKFLIHIYNRWGIEIFSSENRNVSWDGRTTSGVSSTEGIYFYVLTLDEKVYKGFLQLFK